MAGSFGQIKEYPRLENYFIVVSKNISEGSATVILAS